MGATIALPLNGKMLADTPSSYFNGKLDHLSLLSRVLTPAEISYLALRAPQADAKANDPARK